MHVDAAHTHTQTHQTDASENSGVPSILALVTGTANPKPKPKPHTASSSHGGEDTIQLTHPKPKSTPTATSKSKKTDTFLHPGWTLTTTKTGDAAVTSDARARKYLSKQAMLDHNTKAAEEFDQGHVAEAFASSSLKDTHTIAVATNLINDHDLTVSSIGGTGEKAIHQGIISTLTNVKAPKQEKIDSEKSWDDFTKESPWPPASSNDLAPTVSKYLGAVAGLNANIPHPNAEQKALLAKANKQVTDMVGQYQQGTVFRPVSPLTFDSKAKNNIPDAIQISTGGTPGDYHDVAGYTGKSPEKLLKSYDDLHAGAAGGVRPGQYVNFGTSTEHGYRSYGPKHPAESEVPIDFQTGKPIDGASYAIAPSLANKRTADSVVYGYDEHGKLGAWFNYMAPNPDNTPTGAVDSHHPRFGQEFLPKQIRLSGPENGKYWQLSDVQRQSKEIAATSDHPDKHIIDPHLLATAAFNSETVSNVGSSEAAAESLKNPLNVGNGSPNSETEYKIPTQEQKTLGLIFGKILPVVTAVLTPVLGPLDDIVTEGVGSLVEGVGGSAEGGLEGAEAGVEGGIESGLAASGTSEAAGEAGVSESSLAGNGASETVSGTGDEAAVAGADALPSDAEVTAWLDRWNKASDATKNVLKHDITQGLAYRIVQAGLKSSPADPTWDGGIFAIAAAQLDRAGTALDVSGQEVPENELPETES